MKSQYLRKIKLPDAPGIYVFRDTKKRPLYIGRATSLKDRVKSYFSTDLIETRGPRIVDMVTTASALTWQKTDSVLEAIILESNLIKKYQPHYNVDERDDKSSLYVAITDEPWPRVLTIRARDYDHMLKSVTSTDIPKLKFGTVSVPIQHVFGPYPHGGLIIDALKIIRKIFPFKDKKSHDLRHEAFYRALGRSPEGDDTNARRRYARTISNLVLFFEGKKKALRARLEKDMKVHARNMEFEEAQNIKRTLYALDHVNDIALIKNGADKNLADKMGRPGFRIEAYDIAHLSGTNVVGAFTVSVNGEYARDQYRKFKISREVNNDTANLTEVLSRRLNHSEWTYPDLIVVDGNETQLKAAEAVLAVRRSDIPVVAVTKDERHKARTIIGHPDLIKKYSSWVIALNTEVHRFVLAYHRKRRTKMFT